MARQHGITEYTYKRMLIDAGVVYLNYGESGEVKLGATRGGNTFTVETEMREMPVDGAHGPVIGSKRITMVVPKITANFVEIYPQILTLALPGSSISTATADYSTYTRALQIAVSDYATNIAIVGEVAESSGSVPAIFKITNALANGNLEMGLVDKDETVLTVEFTGHFAITDLNTEPWEIMWPEVTTES